MKQTRLAKILAAGTASALTLSVAFAQQTTTTTRTTDPVAGTTTTASTSTTATGEIVDYTPGSEYMTFRTESSASPVRYYYTKDTTIVDPAGQTVAWSDLQPATPATVYYVNQGDRVVVRKVVLSRPVTVHKKTTTTTTTREQ